MGVFKKAAAAVVAASALVAGAAAQVTLPDLGVDLNMTENAMGTDLGAGFMTILGISTVFIIGSILWRWLRRAKG